MDIKRFPVLTVMDNFADFPPNWRVTEDHGKRDEEGIPVAYVIGEFPYEVEDDELDETEDIPADPDSFLEAFREAGRAAISEGVKRKLHVRIVESDRPEHQKLVSTVLNEIIEQAGNEGVKMFQYSQFDYLSDVRLILQEKLTKPGEN